MSNTQDNKDNTFEVVDSLSEEEVSRMAAYAIKGFINTKSIVTCWFFDTDPASYKADPTVPEAFMRAWLVAALDCGILISNKSRTGFRCLYGPDQPFALADPATAKGKSKHLDVAFEHTSKEGWYKRLAQFGAWAHDSFGTDHKALAGFILAVDPEHQHKGIGKGLQDLTESMARDMGLPVAFCTEPHNLPMYQRRGYQVAGQNPTKQEGMGEGTLYWVEMKP